MAHGLRCAFIQFPAKRTCMCARGDAEVFALESILTQRAPLLLQKLRRKSIIFGRLSRSV